MAAISTDLYAENLADLTRSEWRIVARRIDTDAWGWMIPAREARLFQQRRDAGEIISASGRDGSVTTVFAKLAQ